MDYYLLLAFACVIVFVANLIDWCFQVGKKLIYFGPNKMMRFVGIAWAAATVATSVLALAGLDQYSTAFFLGIGGTILFQIHSICFRHRGRERGCRCKCEEE
jgi:hypothetical protein